MSVCGQMAGGGHLEIKLEGGRATRRWNSVRGNIDKR